MPPLRRSIGAHAVLVTVLIVALPVLAALQYRWLGQVSDAERERLQANWKSGAERVAGEIDRELSRAFLHFQRHGTLKGDEPEPAYATKFADWQRVSPYPRLIARGWTFRPDPSGEPIVEGFTADGTLQPAPWPAALEARREIIRAELAQVDQGDALVASRLPLLIDEVPAIVVSLSEIAVRDGVLAPPRFSGFAILQLDTTYLARELLPALIARHIGQADTTQIGVRQRGSENLLYRSADSVTAASLSSPDVSTPILRIRFTDFGELLHGLDDPQAAPRPARNIAVSVYRREMGEPAASAPRTTRERVFVRGGSEEARWTLVVKHRAGSLEAAVARGRLRNLAASFGVLLVLGAAVVALSVSSRRAQRLARQQMDFVAGVSHELRTPLAVIRSAGENLADGVVADPDQVRRYGALVATEGKRLTDMVDQVLQFSGRPGSQPLDRRLVEPGTLLDAVARTWGGLAAHDGFTFTVRADEHLPQVLGDQAALERAIGNLVSNAMKYSGTIRTIDLHAGREGTSPPRLIVSVGDRGPGIPAAERAHVFEPFFRGQDAIARQIHGNGLGLSLVKATVEAHGGRVEIVDRDGGGTLARLILPAVTAVS